MRRYIAKHNNKNIWKSQQKFLLILIWIFIPSCQYHIYISMFFQCKSTSFVQITTINHPFNSDLHTYVYTQIHLQYSAACIHKKHSKEKLFNNFLSQYDPLQLWRHRSISSQMKLKYVCLCVREY